MEIFTASYHGNDIAGFSRPSVGIDVFQQGCDILNNLLIILRKVSDGGLQAAVILVELVPISAVLQPVQKLGSCSHNINNSSS